MSLKILFFGELGDSAQTAAGSVSIELDFSDQTNSLNKLESFLGELHPELGKIFSRGDHLRSINQAIQNENAALHEGDEVAFMSPFSGG
jgi:molybdopterin converting factor small subunit